MRRPFTPMQARQAPTTREFFAMAAAIALWDHDLITALLKGLGSATPA